MKLTLSDGSIGIWNKYADEFNRRWGIDSDAAAIVGGRSSKIIDAEMQEHGSDYYRTSVVLPIRNAFWGMTVHDMRAKFFSGIKMIEPILDYGCGVGFQSMWFLRNGYKEVWCHDLPGIQNEIMKSVCVPAGASIWNGEDIPGTVVLMNVLEHLDNPVETLNKFIGMGSKIVANICHDHGRSQHVASHGQLEECRKLIIDNGNLYEWGTV